MSVIEKRRQQKVVHRNIEVIEGKGFFVTAIDRRRQKIEADTPQESEDNTVIQSVTPSASRLEQHQAVLNVHIQRLKDIKTIDKKIEYKKSALLDIKDFVMAYFNSDHNYPNNVAVIYFIWSMDCGDIDGAFMLGLRLIKQGQKTPKWISSDLLTFFSHAIYDWAAEKLKKGESANPYLENFVFVLKELNRDLHEIVSSKVFAMAAKHADMNKDFKKVVSYGQHAQALNDRAGVKKIIEKAQAQLAKQAAEDKLKDSTQNEVQENDAQKDEQKNSQQDDSITADAPYDDVGE